MPSTEPPMAGFGSWAEVLFDGLADGLFCSVVADGLFASLVSSTDPPHAAAPRPRTRPSASSTSGVKMFVASSCRPPVGRTPLPAPISSLVQGTSENCSMAGVSHARWNASSSYSFARTELVRGASPDRHARISRYARSGSSTRSARGGVPALVAQRPSRVRAPPYRRFREGGRPRALRL